LRRASRKVRASLDDAASASPIWPQLREEFMTLTIRDTSHGITRRHSAAARQAPSIERARKDQELSALMRRAQDGDRIAYAALLKEVLPILKRVVQARLGFVPAMDREDLVQDILLSLHAARATYDPERAFIPWLMTIAHNRMVDQARRNSRRSANEVAVDEYPAQLAEDNPAAGDIGDPEELRRAIKLLPKGQRSAIELLKLREMSLKEAAQATGMSVSALKVSVHRAIKTLRASLQA
jgi:RNA polymerase sigma-70 factor (ECF subfamily)